MRKLRILVLLPLLGAATPLLLRAQTTETYTFTTNRLLPDGNPSGLSDVRLLNSAIGDITSVTVNLKITGEFNGDLYGYLRHASGTTTNFTVLLNRPGKTASNPYGYADSGLNVTFQDGAPNGDIHLYQTNTIPPAGSPLTGAWQPDDRDVDPAAVLDSSPRTTALANFHGLNAAGDWTLFLADLQSGGTNQLTQWSLTIVGAAYPTLAWAKPADIVYGTALGASQLNATATFDSTNVPGTFTYSPAAGAVLNAGAAQTLSVTFTPTDTTTFLPVTTNVTLNVDPAPLTITASNASQVYGAATPALALGYSGFVNGDTASSLTTAAALSATGAPPRPVGSYPITASGATSPNYTITYVPGTLTIAPASTSGAVASSANPALPGATVTFTMTISPVAPGAGAPTGTVNFRIDGGIAGSGGLSGGAAVFATSALAHGSHTVVAEYAGDGNFLGVTNSLPAAQIIDTPPVAGNLTIERYPTLGVKVSLAAILATCSDAAGDPLTITVSPTSANGGAITVSEGWVFYAPADGFTNADSFTYTVTDPYGGSAVGAVTVAIFVDTSPGQNLTITDLGNGSYLIVGSGIPGYTYRLESTPTLGPADWQAIPGASVTADSTGAFQYTDTPAGGAQFYRSIYP
ncbi:MAG: MBG domain-containing protein [Verrucomicrobiota bacterium]